MDPSTVPSAHFSTGQFEAWRESISVVFEVEPPVRPVPTPFGATVEAFQLGDMIVTDARLGDQRYVRSAARARRDGMDHFVFNLYRTGGWEAQTNNSEFKGLAGQVQVLDLSRDLVSDEPTSDLATLFVPRSLIEDRLPNLTALHGCAPTGPHAWLLVEFIDLLARRLPTLPSGSEQELSRAICDMLAACLRPSLDGLEIARSGLEAVLLRRARRFIDARLSSPELGAEALCRGLGVSRRTLYRMFEPEGGVQHYIQGKRLERMRSCLTDPTETRRISDVAAEYGFLRNDHFARAFKHQFGLPPRDVRDLPVREPSATAAASTAKGAIRGFDSWIRELHA